MYSMNTTRVAWIQLYGSMHVCTYERTNNISTFYVCMHTTTSLVPRILLRLVLGSIHTIHSTTSSRNDKYIIINNNNNIYIYILM